MLPPFGNVSNKAEMAEKWEGVWVLNQYKNWKDEGGHVFRRRMALNCSSIHLKLVTRFLLWCLKCSIMMLYAFTNNCTNPCLVDKYKYSVMASMTSTWMTTWPFNKSNVYNMSISHLLNYICNNFSLLFTFHLSFCSPLLLVITPNPFLKSVVLKVWPDLDPFTVV